MDFIDEDYENDINSSAMMMSSSRMSNCGDIGDPRLSTASRPFRDLLNLSTISIAPSSITTNTCKDEDDPFAPLYHFSIKVDNVPYSVTIYMNSQEKRLYADFEDETTGKVRRKRLSSTWLHPPVSISSSPEDWYRANIGTVLAKSRGPECTPRKPPGRLPPSVPTAQPQQHQLQQALDEANRQMKAMAEQMRAQAQELEELQRKQQQPPPPAAPVIDTVDDESIVVAMLKEDLREEQALRAKAEHVAATKTRLCLETLDEADKLERELDQCHAHNAKTIALLTEMTKDVHLSKAQITVLESQLREAKLTIDNLQSYSSGLLHNRSHS